MFVRYRLSLLTLSLICLLFSQAYGQLDTVDSLISIYRKNGKDCLLQEDKILSQGKFNGGFLFDTLMPRLVIEQNLRPNVHVQIRLLRLQANAASYAKAPEAKQNINPVSIQLTNEAIQLCIQQGDDILLAATYFDMAELYSEYKKQEVYLTMLARAYEIADKIGLDLFPKQLLYYKLHAMCRASYKILTFRESLAYGLRAIKAREHCTLPAGDLADIYLYDLMGSSYKKLQQPDSSIYFYKELLNTLAPLQIEPEIKKLWYAIAWGNIGENLTMKGELNKGYPLLKNWLDQAKEFKDELNICLSEIALGQNLFQQRDYNNALRHWKGAYYWSRKNNYYESGSIALKGMAQIFEKKKNIDSTVFYLNLAHIFSDSLHSLISYPSPKAIQARIKLDELHMSLKYTTLLLEQEKLNKRLVLIGIMLLIMVAALIYNRQQLKTNYKIKWALHQKDLAENEVAKAKKHINSFLNNIREKNQLINTLRKKIEENDTMRSKQEVFENLDSYMLVSEEEWMRFRSDFIKAYPEFLPTLALKIPQITPAEERLSILIFLRLNGNQISTTLGIARKSVTRARHRLAKRMGLLDASELDSIIANELKNIT